MKFDQVISRSVITRTLLASAISLALVACAQQFRIQAVETKSAPPSGLQLTLKASGPGAEAVAMTPSNVTVEEDGVLMVPGLNWNVQNVDTRDKASVAILLDLNGFQEPDDKLALADAVRKFMTQLGEKPSVAVLGYDGNATPQEIVPFGSGHDATSVADAIVKTELRDSSTDLYSSFLFGVRVLENRMAQGLSEHALLVLIANGPDRAKRIAPGVLKSSLAKARSKVERYLVTLAPPTRGTDYDWLGSYAPLRAAKVSELDKALSQVFLQVEVRGRSHHMLSYCSPSRAGLHKLRVRVSHSQVMGNRPISMTGEFVHEFSADGFGPGCDLAALSKQAPPAANLKATPSSQPLQPAVQGSSSSAPSAEVKPPVALPQELKPVIPRKAEPPRGQEPDLRLEFVH